MNRAATSTRGADRRLLCVGCRYDLGGQDFERSWRCPECGAPVAVLVWRQESGIERALVGLMVVSNALWIMAGIVLALNFPTVFLVIPLGIIGLVVWASFRPLRVLYYGRPSRGRVVAACVMLALPTAGIAGLALLVFLVLFL